MPSGTLRQKLRKMNLDEIKLVVFDMAGTTVQDHNEVLLCFRQACLDQGLEVPDSRLNALMGVSKLEVFHTLWREHGVPADRIAPLADASFEHFREILERYYHDHPVKPVDGVLVTFAWLRHRGIKIALNTGFYRTVTDIILNKLGWDKDMDVRHVSSGTGSIIDCSISSDEVPHGRPAPDMIRQVMKLLDVPFATQVVKVGDTPVDLLEGRNAGCLLSLAVTNGTHSREELAGLDHDGLLYSVTDLPDFLMAL
jgi:phosphonatase-like hydrolase